MPDSICQRRLLGRCAVVRGAFRFQPHQRRRSVAGAVRRADDALFELVFRRLEVDAHALRSGRQRTEEGSAIQLRKARAVAHPLLEKFVVNSPAFFAVELHA
jgi:hypothetical protein